MLEILSDLKISNCETRHCSVVSVGCPLYSDTQLIDSWQLWRGRAGDALDSVRQDRHYARKVALVTSVMVVILPPIWKLLSLISLMNLLFSLVISLKVRRDRTQYPPESTTGNDNSLHPLLVSLKLLSEAKRFSLDEIREETRSLRQITTLLTTAAVQGTVYSL